MKHKELFKLFEPFKYIVGILGIVITIFFLSVSRYDENGYHEDEYVLAKFKDTSLISDEAMLSVAKIWLDHSEFVKTGKGLKNKTCSFHSKYPLTLHFKIDDNLHIKKEDCLFIVSIEGVVVYCGKFTNEIKLANLCELTCEGSDVFRADSSVNCCEIRLLTKNKEYYKWIYENKILLNDKQNVYIKLKEYYRYILNFDNDWWYNYEWLQERLELFETDKH